MNLTSIFSKQSLFSHISSTTLNQWSIKQYCSVVFYEKDEMLFDIGSPVTHLGIILSGEASVFSVDNGKPLLLRTLQKNQPFNVCGLLDAQKHISLVKMSKSGSVLWIGAEGISRLIALDPDFAKTYICFLSDRIRFLNQKIVYISAGKAERRLALYLLSLGDNEVTLPLSISDLADQLDLGRASLYRAFDRMIADGFMEKRGKSLLLKQTNLWLETYQN